MPRIKVVLLCGGSSNEREISIKSANEIEEKLGMIYTSNEPKYTIIKIELPPNTSNKWVHNLLNNAPDIVIIGLHGGKGENGSVQGLLESLNIPYIGSKVLSSAICMDKKLSKQILQINHIPVAEDIYIKKNEEIKRYEKQIEMIGYPLVIKPNSGGSSKGIKIAKNWDELIMAAEEAKNYNDDYLIEKYIDGQEISCPVIETKNGLQVLTILDIDTNNVIFDYGAKYENNSAKINLSSLPSFLQVMIHEIAKCAFKALKCHGYAVVDMIIREEQVYVLELNTLPGLTAHSLIPTALNKIGIHLGKFLDDLITFQLKRLPKNN